MQSSINKFLEGKSIYEFYYTNQEIFDQFKEKPLLIVSETNDIEQEVQEKLIIQDKYRKLNNTFFKKNKLKIDVVNINKKSKEITIIESKENNKDKKYTFKFDNIFPKQKEKLPVIHNFSIKANRRVYRAFSQTRKVLNALLKKYKEFKNINIELARDLYLSQKKKKELINSQNKNRKNNEEAKANGFQPKK